MFYDSDAFTALGKSSITAAFVTVVLTEMSFASNHGSNVYHFALCVRDNR